MAEGAREWFEWIEAERREIAEAEAELERMRAATGLRGASLGTVSGGGGDGSGLQLAVIQQSDELDMRRSRLGDRLYAAEGALYGPGGLASTGHETEAGCIWGHYVRGMSWADVAGEVTRVGSAATVSWCRYRAGRGFALLDRMGVLGV